MSPITPMGPMRPVSPPAVWPAAVAANPLLDRWMSVLADGTVQVRVGKVELGQGILTALAQLAADELDVAPGDLRMLAAHSADGPDEAFTAGSLSIEQSGAAVRLIGANVRALFVRAAAARWGVDPGEVTVREGTLSCRRDGARTRYADLASRVDLHVPPDPAVTVKAVADQVVTGTSAPRLDLPDKVAGRARFLHDVRLPGQLFGRVIRPPGPGARLVTVDQRVPAGTGLRVVRDGSFLAVIGPDEAQVVRHARTLSQGATWQESDTLPDEDALEDYLRAGPHQTVVLADELPVDGPGPAGQGAGGRDGAAAARSVRASYSRPFLAHASMAPSCGLAWWRPDGTVAVWSHSQGIVPLRDAIAGALGLDVRRLVVEHVEGAGCYGHNGADDAAFDAVLLARAVAGHPVLVQWTRSDELTWAPFGSAMAADLAATQDEQGRITSWRHDVWSQGHLARPGYDGVPGLLAATHLDPPACYPAPTDPPVDRGGGSTRNALPIYTVGARRVAGHRLLRTAVRTSALRSLGAYLNVFAIESFMDELAALAGRDPLEYRLAHLNDDRARRVLAAAAAAGHWGDPVPDGTGRGLGLARYKGTGAYCAVVAEVEAERDVRVAHLSIAVDVGRVVNPDGVRNQIEGGATQSVSWTLKERVRFDRRRITSRDWESYPILTFRQAPTVSVEIMDGLAHPSVGAGEAAQGPTAAAVANAVAAAIGVRVRRLPLTRDAVLAAIDEPSPPG